MSNVMKMIMAILLGIIIGAGAVALLNKTETNQSVENSADNKPLYWVAPMDANYRRDKPGKSPMGMDLIPVYESSTQASDDSAGTVTITPHVINNLGVRTAVVESKSMQSVITTVGYVQYDQDKLIHIHPRVDGWIEKLFVTAAGNPISKGQPIYTLYSPQLVNAQEEFLIALKRNNKSLIIAARERLEALQLPTSFIKTLEKTRLVEQTITFFAPQSGVVADLKIREGFYVKPGNTLMSIGKLDQVWVEAEVFERDAELVQAGLNVSMTLDYLPAKEWLGTVDYVYPTLNAQTRTLRVRLKFDNPSLELKPNMFAQVAISTQSSGESVVVPKESVIRTGKQDRLVLALGDGKFKSIAVVIGRVGDRYIEILEGIKAGERVVSSAQFLIDSESSKNSDFKRISMEDEPQSVWMQGVVNRVMTNHRMVNISHQPVNEWDWPEMTMDFPVDKGVDMTGLSSGQNLHFEVSKIGDEFHLTGIHIMDNEQTVEFPSARVNGVVNHIEHVSRTLNISREAIEKWQRPAATLDFLVADSVDLKSLTVGMEINFTFEVRDELVVVEISSDVVPQASESVDHSHH